MKGFFNSCSVTWQMHSMSIKWFKFSAMMTTFFTPPFLFYRLYTSVVLYLQYNVRDLIKNVRNYIFPLHCIWRNSFFRPSCWLCWLFFPAHTVFTRVQTENILLNDVHVVSVFFFSRYFRTVQCQGIRYILNVELQNVEWMNIERLNVEWLNVEQLNIGRLNAEKLNDEQYWRSNGSMSNGTERGKKTSIVPFM
jgi:hypothetical protein